MLTVQPSKQITHMKVSFLSISKTLLMLYLFIAVNDIVSVPFGMLWLKDVLLFFVFLGLLIKPNFKFNEYLTYIFIASSLFIVSFTVAVSYGNNLDYALTENLGLFVALIVPLIVLDWVNADPEKIIKISKCFLWAMLFATLHKILFILFLQGYLSFGFFDFLYKDVSGRGEIGGLDRLQTGNQLLVTFSVFMALRFFILGYKRWFMSFAMLAGVMNTYLAGSLFFTPITFTLLGALIFLGIKGKWILKSFLLISVMYLSYFISIDLQSSRAVYNIGDSNFVRLIQNKALFESFLAAPWFGNGSGYYIAGLNDYTLPWAFENQVLAVFAKYGLFGFVAIAALLVLQFRMCKLSLSLFYYIHFIALIVLASIFNPYMFGTYAAWAFSISLILAYLFKESNRELILPHHAIRRVS